MGVVRRLSLIPFWGVALTGGGAAAERPDPLAFYPPAARAQGVEGSAVLSCTVNRQGRLEACEVVTENPAGWSFGEAALRMSSSFQMRPQKRDGVPVGGARVRIPVRFQLPDPTPTGPRKLTLTLASSFHS